MKNNITNREDLFLAKIAGYDIDIKTMTPPTVSNVREKLLLDIAEKIKQKSTDEDGVHQHGYMLVNYSRGEVDASIPDIYSAWDSGTTIFMQYNGYIVPLSYASENEIQFLVTTVSPVIDYSSEDYNVTEMIIIDGSHNSNGEDVWNIETLTTDSIPPKELRTTRYTANEENNEYIPREMELNITAGELYRYIETGHSVKINFTIERASGSYKRINGVIPIEAFCKESGATPQEKIATYYFRARFDMRDADHIFTSDFLSENDTVVLTRID